MNRNLSPDEFSMTEDTGIVQVWKGDSVRAEVTPPKAYDRKGENYFVAWMESGRKGGGTQMIQHLNSHYGKRPHFSDPEENTESGNHFIESLRRKGLA